MRVEVDGYTVVFEADRRLHALRHGQPWRDCVGDNLILCLAMEVERLRGELAARDRVTPVRDDAPEVPHLRIDHDTDGWEVMQRVNGHLRSRGLEFVTTDDSGDGRLFYALQSRAGSALRESAAPEPDPTTFRIDHDTDAREVIARANRAMDAHGLAVEFVRMGSGDGDVVYALRGT